MGESIQGFRDLRVWQAAMDFVADTYRLTQDLPAQETYGLLSQMRRAAVSIPSNIAEGHARSSTKDFLRHLSIAQGSIAEIETQLEISQRLDYLSPEAVAKGLTDCRALSRQLHGLVAALEKRLSPIPDSRFPPKGDSPRRSPQ